jgi:hypothetical protein
MSNPRHRVEKLRLRRGDVLVCRDPGTLQMLSEMKFPFLTFQVPLVFAPYGIEKVPLDQLKRIVREVESTSQLIIAGKI